MGSGRAERAIAEVIRTPAATRAWPGISADGPHGRVPAAPEPLIRLSRHDRLQLEIKLDAPIPVVDRRRSDYELDVTFLLPQAIGIGRGETDPSELYDDLRAFTRLKTPVVDASDLGLEARARLERLAASTTDLGGPEATETRRAARREARILVRAYRSACRALLARIQDRGDIDAARALVTASLETRESFRELTARLLDRRSSERTRRGLAACDEFLSLSIEHNATLALRGLERSVAPDPVQGELAALVTEEIDYRRRNGWRTVLDSNSDETEEEVLIEQVGRLKKYVSRVLHLRSTPSAAHAWARHAAFAVAAAIAMAWTVAVQVLIFVALGVNLDSSASASVITFASLALVAAYILKDRIKATLGQRLSGWLPRWLDDRWTNLTWRDEKRKFARVAERMSFVGASDVEADVVARRVSVRDDPLAALHDEDALRYVRRIVARPRHAAGALDGFIGFNDIIRLNVARWCRTLASPSRRFALLDDDGRVRERKLPNHYNVDVVATLRIDGEVVSTADGRLVLNQRGIVRVEG